MTDGPIGRIRSRVRGGRYRFTEHALDEMGEDGLSSVEVEQSVLSGRVVRIQWDEHGRKRYTIEGQSLGGRQVRTVCRYDDLGGRVVVITVYEIGEG